MARREHSSSELFIKLQRKGFADDEIQSVMQALANENLFNEARFIENYLHHRRTKGYGPLRIHAELMARGITEDIILQYLKVNDRQWFAEAQRVWQKRFKNKKPTDFKARAQQMRFLQYRGFTTEHIQEIFKSSPLPLAGVVA